MTNVVNFSGATRKFEVTRADIMDLDDYIKIRIEKRKALVQTKQHRRVSIGPHATFYFESYDTMWLQIHEMLYIEKGGEQQIPDELAAYNPLIPNGRELVATLMFEIDDEPLRKRVLGGLGGVEKTVFIKIGDREINAVAEEDVDRTNAEGKASSVQFLHFPFTDADVEAFKREDTEIVLGIRHENYPHMTLLQAATKAELQRDFA